ncbi:MAG: biopolymer transporter ExbD [Acidobacteriota bacterium]|nr:MAG: biopolymer transporter ExbD [Acidobacteriota bacterium]
MAISGGGGSSVSGVSSEINVTPMADVMLVLLIIFMITTPLIQSGVAVNMATASNAQEAPEAEAEDATTVTITRASEFYVNKQLTPEAGLMDKIAEAYAKAPDKPLFVRVDVATPFGSVVRVVDMSREVGVERIGLLVDREREEGGLF